MEALTPQRPEIFFINHACIQINSEDTTLFCDPWFSGSVFNSSWALLKNHSPDWSSVKQDLVIWISHEHPDHLHFPTLKEIRARHVGVIPVFYKAQANPNVKEALNKLGFTVVELEEGQTKRVANNLEITQYSEKADSAAVIKVEGKTIFNQNDCLLSKNKMLSMKARFPNIDFWFFQFSLAGYYANEDDSKRLMAAHDRHLNLIKTYMALARPSIFIPFASFIYFSKKGNSYLNKFRVTPAELVDEFGTDQVQLLWFGDRVKSEHWQSRNQKNVASWMSIWDDVKIEDSTQALPDNELLTEAMKFIGDFKAIPKWLRPPAVSIRLRESRRQLKLDLRSQTTSISEPSDYVCAEVGDEDFLFFLRFPWGADTLNITGNLKIVNQLKWRRLAYLKHLLYAMKDRAGWQKGLIAYLGAIVRTIQFNLN